MLIQYPTYILESISHKDWWCVYDAQGKMLCHHSTKEYAQSISTALNGYDQLLLDIQVLKKEVAELKAEKAELKADGRALLKALEPIVDMCEMADKKDYVMTNNSQRHYEKWKEGEWEVFDLDISLKAAAQTYQTISKKYGE
jgi:hypothetical protein